MTLIRPFAIPVLSLFLAPASTLHAEDLTPKVLSLLESKCKECHHPDTNDDFPYLHQASVIAGLIEDEILVAGDPDESAIFRRVSMEVDSKKRMPKSRGAEGDETYRPPLSAEEQQLIKDWVVQLKDGVPTTGPAMTATTTPAPSTAAVAVDSPKDAPPATPETPKATPPAPGVKASVSDNNEELPSGLSLTDKVHWILDQRCSQCHAGDYEPELHGTINLATFFSEKDASGKILLSDALVERTLRSHEADGRMPKSKGNPGEKGYRPPLGAVEQETLRKWADSGRPKEVKRDFISNNDVIKAIYTDLQSASEAEQGFFRYLTLSTLYNQSDEEGNALVPDLDPHRAAISKLMNSLSMNARITRPTAIDEAKTIYRVDLRDYEWTAADWENVISYYPYGITGIDRQKEQLIERFTGSKMAYLRADWFTFAAAQPPLYDQIMDKLLGFEVTGPDDDVLGKLEHALGVDRFTNLQEGRAIRAGFQYSGVSGANRLIERHELGSHRGAYWISYDFTPQSARRAQDLTLAPLGPLDAHLTDKHDHMFEHDGGEMVYNLPNGLQGYMLTTNKGKRLDRAPIEIVQDDNRQDKVIINGISCMTCHQQGMRPPVRVPDLSKRTLEMMEDEIRPLVEAAGTLDFREKKLLEKLYPDPAVLQAAIKTDFERFTKADAEATMGMAGATEPIWGLYNEFRSPVTARMLAAEFGMEFDELLLQLGRESDQSETLSVISSSMERGLSMRRENLLREYIAVVYALGYELMPFVPMGYEEFGGQKYADLIANSDQFLAAFGHSGLSVADTKKAVVGSSSAETLAQESVLLHGGGKLRISIQPNLKVGDRARLEVVATDDTHVRIYHLSSDKHVTELFPGSTNKGTFRPKNKKLEVSWETTAPGGAEHVIVYASESEIRNIAAGDTVGDFVIFEKDALFSSRGIPKAIRAAELETSAVIPAQIIQARIGYLLKE